MDGRTVVHLTIITALDNIKPKAPKILLVMPMENGNYKVTWNTNYPAENPISESLQIQLMYNKKGKPDEAPRIANASQPFHEILGNELEPSSEYVVKARSRSPLYGTQFSDWSQEVEWTSSASVWNVLIAIIPVLCALLIISICAFYWCCTRLKDKWWDNIPTPTIEIKDKLLGKSEFFIPQNYDPSSYRTEFLTIVNTKEEPGPTLWISECEQVGPYKNVSSHTSTKDSGVFSSDDSQKTFSDSAGSCSSSDSGYKNVLYTTLAATPSQNTSSQALPSSGTPDLSARPAVGCEFCPIYREVEVLKATSSDPQQEEAPRIAIDCKYPVEEDNLKCPSGVDGLDDALPLNACRADDGYESFGEAVSRAALGQVRFPACTLEPSEEGYQALETLVDWRSEADRADRKASSVERTDQSTGHEWEPSQCPTWNIPDSITCASPFMQRSSMESSSNSALTTCPIMQIYTDSSYQRV
ncbi:uncharacterized protein LOC133113970 isoform X2 [Conger conger]|nr:uncharacterized protein LOC133113970 isoform X2 [Conger conger]